MLVLAFDTSTLFGSVGWVELDDGAETATIRRQFETSSRARPGHAETLLDSLVEALEQGGAAVGDVDLVVYGRGPGTFTGLRIGMSVAKGLCLANGIEALGISSLEATALSSGAVGLVVPVIDARRQEVYYGVYNVNQSGESRMTTALGDERVGSISDLVVAIETVLEDGESSHPIFLTGNGLEPYGDELQSKLGDKVQLVGAEKWIPSAIAMARLGYHRFKTDGPDDIDAAEPVYLRKPDARLPGAQNR